MRYDEAMASQRTEGAESPTRASSTSKGESPAPTEGLSSPIAPAPSPDTGGAGRLYLGLDLGGTKIASALVTEQGKMVARLEISTPSLDGPEEVIASLVTAAQEVCLRAGVPLASVTAAGLGAPGPVDASTGTLVEPPNLPRFRTVPLGAMLSARLGLPLTLDNDANAAGLAEVRFGAGQGASSLVYMTISTGIGGALFFGGALWRGAAGAAGELGHLVIQPDGPLCGCGGRGCLEAVASGTAIAREARLALSRGVPSILAGRDHPEQISARDVAEAAAGGDSLAQEILERAFGLLGLGVAGLVNALNPARVVLGGGLAALGDRLLLPVREGVGRHANSVAARSVEITLAALGQDAGVVGAAALAMPPEVSRI